MLRKILLILSLIGLFLTIGSWAASFFNLWYVNSSSPRSSIRWGYGCIGYVEADSDPRLPVFTGWNLKGFSRVGIVSLPSYQAHPGLFKLYIPLWMPMILFGWSAWILYRPISSRRRRQRAGLCVKCGYSLTGLTEPRCPECSMPFEKLS